MAASDTEDELLPTASTSSAAAVATATTSATAARTGRRLRNRNVLNVEDSDNDSSGSGPIAGPSRRRTVPVTKMDLASESSEWESDWNSDEEQLLAKGDKDAVAAVLASKLGYASDESSGSGSSGDGEKCPICLLSLHSQEVGVPEVCEHVFCAPCIEEWSRNVSTCPIDRKGFELINIYADVERRSVLRVYRVQPKPPEADDGADGGVAGGAGTGALATAPVDDELTYCEVCRQAHSEETMLLCDSCNLGYHMECLNPPLLEIPSGSWYCDCCFASGSDEDDNELQDLLDDLNEIGGMRESRLRQRIHSPLRIVRTRQSERIRAAILTRAAAAVRLNIVHSSPDGGGGTASGPSTVAAARARRLAAGSSAHGGSSSSSSLVAVAQPPRARKTVKRKRRRRTRRKILSMIISEYDVEDDGGAAGGSAAGGGGDGQKFAIKRKKLYSTLRKLRKKRAKRRKTSGAAGGSGSGRRRSAATVAAAAALVGESAAGELLSTSGALGGALQRQRIGAGITPLKIFGGRNDLDYFSDDDDEEEGGSSGTGAAGSTLVAGGVAMGSRLRNVLGRRRVLKSGFESFSTPSPGGGGAGRAAAGSGPGADLLGSILANQERWHSREGLRNVRINGGKIIFPGEQTTAPDRRRTAPTVNVAANTPGTSTTTVGAGGNAAGERGGEPTTTASATTTGPTNSSSNSIITNGDGGGASGSSSSNNNNNNTSGTETQLFADCKVSTTPRKRKDDKSGEEEEEDEDENNKTASDPSTNEADADASTSNCPNFSVYSTETLEYAKGADGSAPYDPLDSERRSDEDDEEDDRFAGERDEDLVQLDDDDLEPPPTVNGADGPAAGESEEAVEATPQAAQQEKEEEQEEDDGTPARDEFDSESDDELKKIEADSNRGAGDGAPDRRRLDALTPPLTTSLVAALGASGAAMAAASAIATANFGAPAGLLREDAGEPEDDRSYTPCLDEKYQERRELIDAGEGPSTSLYRSQGSGLDAAGIDGMDTELISDEDEGAFGAEEGAPSGGPSTSKGAAPSGGGGKRKDPTLASFKKVTKKGRERNYRDKDIGTRNRRRSPRSEADRNGDEPTSGGEGKSSTRNRARRPKRKELPRYDIRSIIAEKRPRIYKDPFGRDITPKRRTRTRTPPSRSRSRERGRPALSISLSPEPLPVAATSAAAAARPGRQRRRSPLSPGPLRHRGRASPLLPPHFRRSSSRSRSRTPGRGGRGRSGPLSPRSPPPLPPQSHPLRGRYAARSPPLRSPLRSLSRSRSPRSPPVHHHHHHHHRTHRFRQRSPSRSRSPGSPPPAVTRVGRAKKKAKRKKTRMVSISRSRSRSRTRSRSRSPSRSRSRSRGRPHHKAPQRKKKNKHRRGSVSPVGPSLAPAAPVKNHQTTTKQKQKRKKDRKRSPSPGSRTPPLLPSGGMLTERFGKGGGRQRDGSWTPPPLPPLSGSGRLKTNGPQMTVASSSSTSAGAASLTVILTNEEALAKQQQQQQHEESGASRSSKQARKEARRREREAREKNSTNTGPSSGTGGSGGGGTLPSKEVFTSGDNILVSVSFNDKSGSAATGKAGPAGEHGSDRHHHRLGGKHSSGTRREKQQQDASGSLRHQPKSKRLEGRLKHTGGPQRMGARSTVDGAQAKPVVIIDLDGSPFRVLTPSPKAVIVLSDSDTEKDNDRRGGATAPAATASGAPGAPSVGGEGAAGGGQGAQEKEGGLRGAPGSTLGQSLGLVDGPNALNGGGSGVGPQVSGKSGKTPPERRSPLLVDDMFGPKTPPGFPASSNRETATGAGGAQAQSLKALQAPKFSMQVKTKSSNVRPVNPLYDPGDLDEGKEDSPSGDRQQQQQDGGSLAGVGGDATATIATVGPNTPPEPAPQSPSPDVYDPFEPTKSPSPSPTSGGTTRDRSDALSIGRLSDEEQTVATTKSATVAGSSGAAGAEGGLKDGIGGGTIGAGDIAMNGGTEARTPPLIGRTNGANVNAKGPVDQSGAASNSDSDVIFDEFVVPPASSAGSQVVNSSLISKLPLPLAAAAGGGQHQQPAANAAGKFGDFMNPTDSPYSPGASDFDDLFEPPGGGGGGGGMDMLDSPPLHAGGHHSKQQQSNHHQQQQQQLGANAQSSMAMGGRSSKPMPPTKAAKKSTNQFDSLFGSSPNQHAGGKGGRSGRKGPHKRSKGGKSNQKGDTANDEDPSKLSDKEKYLKKLNRLERVVEEVKLVIKPYYNKKQINKDEYKDILRRAVPKICHSRTGEINPIKIQKLIKAYVRKIRAKRRLSKKGSGGGGGGGGLGQLGGGGLPMTNSNPIIL